MKSATQSRAKERLFDNVSASDAEVSDAGHSHLQPQLGNGAWWAQRDKQTGYASDKSMEYSTSVSSSPQVTAARRHEEAKLRLEAAEIAEVDEPATEANGADGCKSVLAGFMFHLVSETEIRATDETF